MPLISNSLFKTLTDQLAGIWEQTQNAFGNPSATPSTSLGHGSKTGNPVAGTVRNNISTYLNNVVASNDIDVELDLDNNANSVYTNKTGVENIFQTLWQALVTDINNHCGRKGASVAASIVDINTYTSYYNGGAGGSRFNLLMHPTFAAVLATVLPSLSVLGVNVMSPALHPLLGALPANGMGTLTYNNTFTAGVAVNTIASGTVNGAQTYSTATPNYAEVNLVCEVTTSFAAGTSPPTIQILTGQTVDDQGATTTTWGQVTIPAVGSANNPSAALPTQTVSSGAIVPGSVNVTIGASLGMCVGQVLTVNKGLPDQEYVIVTAVPDGTHVTAIFKKNHAASATLDGQNSVALGTTTPAGRRCRSITALTAGTSGTSLVVTAGHNAGAVRIVGVQDRAALIA